MNMKKFSSEFAVAFQKAHVKYPHLDIGTGRALVLAVVKLREENRFRRDYDSVPFVRDEVFRPYNLSPEDRKQYASLVGTFFSARRHKF